MFSGDRHPWDTRPLVGGTQHDRDAGDHGTGAFTRRRAVRDGRVGTVRPHRRGTGKGRFTPNENGSESEKDQRINGIFCTRFCSVGTQLKGLNRGAGNVSFTLTETDSVTDSDSNSKPVAYIVLCRICSHCTDLDSDPYSLFQYRTGIAVRGSTLVRLRQCK